MPCVRGRYCRCVMHHVQGGGKYLFVNALEATAHFHHANDCCKQKRKGKCNWKAERAVWKMCDWC